MDRTTAHDAALVASALDGDTSAFAEIYDRYADRVFTMCAHLLSSRHDAADVCGDVFLIAAERLGQLRDPSRLKPWLFAIARRQVYLRTRRRSRHVLFGELDDMSQSLPSDEVGAGAEAAELAALLREASAGLDDTDRVVLELTLQGLDGNDLADALGVSANNAYQASHRMKERLERSVGALLVARQGRADCSDLDAVLHTWDGRFSVLWRKRVARHVDGCDVCGERRRAVPVLLFRGVAGAAPPFAAAPSIRTRVLGAANVGAGSARPWPGDGFPPPDRRHRRLAAFIGAAAVLVMVVTGAVVGVALTGGDGGGPVATVTSTDAPAAQPGDTAAGPSSPTSTSVPGTSSTTSAPVIPLPDPPTTTAGAPASTAPPPPAAPGTTVSPAPPPPAPTTVAPTTTTVAPTTTTVPPAPPVIVSFSATAGVGSPCAPPTPFRTTLVWRTTGGTAVAITALGVNLSGLPAFGTTVACRDTPSAPGGWTMTVAGPGGSTSRNVP